MIYFWLYRSQTDIALKAFKSILAFVNEGTLVHAQVFISNQNNNF